MDNRDKSRMELSLRFFLPVALWKEAGEHWGHGVDGMEPIFWLPTLSTGFDRPYPLVVPMGTAGG